MKTFKEFISEADASDSFKARRKGGKVSPEVTRRQVARDDRRAEARRRAEEKAKQGIDSIIGSDEERKIAKIAREQQPKIQQELRRKSMRDRMKKAAERLGIDEENGSPYQEYKGKPQPKPSTPPEGWEEFKKKYLRGKMGEKKKPEQ